MGETTEHAGATDSYACARDYQLFGPGPKRVLALDGGGVRGAITVAFLERIEALLSQHNGRPIRLGDHFHLVGVGQRPRDAVLHVQHVEGVRGDGRQGAVTEVEDARGLVGVDQAYRREAVDRAGDESGDDERQHG